MNPEILYFITHWFIAYLVNVIFVAFMLRFLYPSPRVNWACKVEHMEMRCCVVFFTKRIYWRIFYLSFDVSTGNKVLWTDKRCFWIFMQQTRLEVPWGTRREFYDFETGLVYTYHNDNINRHIRSLGERNFLCFRNVS